MIQKTVRKTKITSHVSSDARVGNVVDERIRPALESGVAVNGTKPVLLVIDEIDGATGAGDNVSQYTQRFHSES